MSKEFDEYNRFPKYIEHRFRVHLTFIRKTKRSREKAMGLLDFLFRQREETEIYEADSFVMKGLLNANTVNKVEDATKKNMRDQVSTEEMEEIRERMDYEESKWWN